MLDTITKEKQWTLVRQAQALVRPLGAAGTFLGLITLAGYYADIEGLYRPISDGSATNPLTALCLILTGAALHTSSGARGVWIPRLLVFAVIIITSLRFLDEVLNSSMAMLITPFQNQVIDDLAMGHKNSMGINSAIMLFCVALSLILNTFQRLTASQFLAYIAIAIPTISFTGYVYGIENFYGQMSIQTTLIGFALSIAAINITAYTGAARSVLSPYTGGKIARIQIVLGYAVPTLLGYVFFQTVNSNEFEMFGLLMVTICWFIIFMSGISAIYQEKVDQQRRKMERSFFKAAMTDQLTGLPNRRKFYEFGEHEIKRVQRTKGQLWLLMLDIDHFKRVNDLGGHDMGDHILVTLGKVLNQSVRSVDLVCRLGGEEFCIILIDTNREGAERVAEKVRFNIEKTAIKDWTDIHGPVTVSIGCTSNDGSHTLDESYKAADKALYLAKQNGRNQVYFVEPNECK